MSDTRDLSQQELDFLSSVDSPMIANALERLELRDRSDGYVGGRIRCDFPELGTMVARVLTVTVSNAIGRSAGEDGYWQLWESLEAMAGPVTIVMKDASTTPDRVAYAGEIMATLAQRLGAVGMVTDGAMRDLPEVRANGFHYFSQYTCVSHANFELSGVGEPVLLEGQVLATGDILHGDANGLVVVPWEALASLPAAVQQVRAGEARDLAFITGDDFTLAGYRRIRSYGGDSAIPTS